MTVLPRVLVIDDLIGSSDSDAVTRLRRDGYCRCLGLLDEQGSETPSEPVASALVCSGQNGTGEKKTNSLEFVIDVFRQGWPNKDGFWWSAVLVDMMFGDDDRFGLRIIAELHTLAPDVPIIVVSGLDQFEVREGEKLSNACARIHAEAFLAAPGTNNENVPAESQSSPQNLRALLSDVGLIPDPEQEFVGYSLPVCRMLRSIRQGARGNTVGEILLLGEAGSGKTHLGGYARREIARHRNVSVNRVPWTFVALSGTGADHQKQSLFGTVGAANIKAQPGAFEVADHGVVFLDEFGETHPEVQGDLLTVLQPLKDDQGLLYRPVLRMGASRHFQSHAFIVAATNKNLAALVEEGRFSGALLQRLSSKKVLVPPLRDRTSDLPLLINNFVRSHCGALGRANPPEISVPQDVWVDYAQDHSVRELQLLLEEAINGHKRKPLLTQEDVFGREEQVIIPVLRDLSETDDSLDTSEIGSVPHIVGDIKNWATAQSKDYRNAFAVIDRSVGVAKLSLLRDLLEQQKRFTRRSSFELLPIIKVLLGNDNIPNTKSGDVAYQLFEAAGVTERPDDPILAEIWDKRRVPGKKSRARNGGEE